MLIQYLISFIGGATILGSLLINKFFNKKCPNLVNKIVAIIGAAFLICRIFCTPNIIAHNPDNYWGLDSSPLHNNPLTAWILVLIWMSFSSILFTLMRPFFNNIKFAKNIVNYIAPITFILQAVFLKEMCIITEGTNMPIYLTVFYSIETAFGLGLSLFYFIQSIIDREKSNWKDILFMFLGYLVLSIFTMPHYFIQYMFGFQNITNAWEIKGLTFQHRLMFYGNFIFPFIIFFALNGRNFEFRRYCLLYMSLAACIGFCVNYYYKTFMNPWDWPFHLCNTAMFILPLVLMFKMKRLFYFTYFINVIGALLAMLMPSYDITTNIMSIRIITFWMNHYLAFFMPILFVSLHMFDRPKIKQFAYSMGFFCIYFILVLILNVVFTEMGHKVDYFFLNSDYIVDKLDLLGDTFKRLFDIKTVVVIGEHKFIFHWLYQILFFITYIFIGLGVWFVFSEGYRIADSNGLLWFKLMRQRREEKELKIALQGRSLEEPMDKDAGIKFELKNFSKKYASSTRYAVKDANLEVHGGEIFGFLGPNGAGKSTIIKSTVGIQPITSGNISICGYDVGTQGVKAKSLIGFVPDHYALYEKLTGREYINYIADIYDVSEEDRNERLEHYIKLFELEGSIDNMIKTYSHGMKQKITIMAALVHDPKVWILDEPLTGLDPNSIYQVKECMKQHAAKGNIVFFSSHIIDIVEKLCSRIAIIKHGEIQCVTTVADIEANGSTLEEFYLKTIENDYSDISDEDKEIMRKQKEEKKESFFKRLFSKKPKKELEKPLEETEEPLKKDCNKDSIDDIDK